MRSACGGRSGRAIGWLLEKSAEAQARFDLSATIQTGSGCADSATMGALRGVFGVSTYFGFLSKVTLVCCTLSPVTSQLPHLQPTGFLRGCDVSQVAHVTASGCTRRSGARTAVLALVFVAVGDGLVSRSRPPLATRRPSTTTRQDRALAGSGRDTGGLAALPPAPTPSSTATSAATPPPASAPDATARPERTGSAHVFTQNRSTYTPSPICPPACGGVADGARRKRISVAKQSLA